MFSYDKNSMQLVSSNYEENKLKNPNSPFAPLSESLKEQKVGFSKTYQKAKSSKGFGKTHTRIRYS